MWLMLAVACHEEPVSLSSHKACARDLYEQAEAALEQDSTHQGEQLLHSAIRQAQSEDDLHTLYLAQLGLAQCLSWGDTEGALRMARRALETYEHQPDNARNYIIILDYIGTYASQLAYNTDAPFDEALRYARRAHQLAVEAPDSVGWGLVSQTLTTLANIHWAMQQYPQALRCAREAVRSASPDILIGAQQVLARCLLSCDSLAEAEAVYRQMDYGDDLQLAYIVQSHLAKLALQRSDMPGAEAAIDEAFSHAEQLYFKALEEKEAYYRTDLARQHENEQMHYRQRLLRVIMLSGGTLLLLLSGVALREVRLRRREHTRHLRETESQREQLRQRDATVDFLKDFILQRSEVVRKLSTGGDRHIALSDREWAEVEHTLDTLDNDCFLRLRKAYPDLREEDIRLCILTRLSLSNRTIGNVYGISISAVQHRKLKLKKEVFGQSDPATTLEQVLDNM